MTDTSTQVKDRQGTLRSQAVVGRFIRSEVVRAVKSIAWQYKLSCDIEQVGGLLDVDLYVTMRGNGESLIKARNAMRRYFESMS